MLKLRHSRRVGAFWQEVKEAIEVLVISNIALLNRMPTTKQKTDISSMENIQ
jgi:hypothetical protein